MELLFDIARPPLFFNDVSKAIVYTTEEVPKWLKHNILRRLEQLGVDHACVDDLSKIDRRRAAIGDYCENVILIRKKGLDAQTLARAKEIRPERLIWILTENLAVNMVEFRKREVTVDGDRLPFTHLMPVEELKLLHYLGKHVSAPGVILEIGPHYGGSTVTLALGNRKNSSPAQIFTVDCLMHASFHRYMQEYGLEEEVSWFEMPSQELARSWASVSESHGGPAIRLLWVDGDHLYPGIKNDLVTFLPYVAEGGCVVLHDYVTAFPGVIQAAWEELYNNDAFEDFTVFRQMLFARKKGGSRVSGAKRLIQTSRPPNAPDIALKWLARHPLLQHKKIALFGGGRHTESLLNLAYEHYSEFAKTICCLIDDSDACCCSGRFPAPVRSLDSAINSEPDYIVISSYDHEPAILDQLQAKKRIRDKLVGIYTNDQFHRFLADQSSVKTLYSEEDFPALAVQ